MKLYWKTYSDTGVFRWFLQNLWEHLFLKNTSGQLLLNIFNVFLQSNGHNRRRHWPVFCKIFVLKNFAKFTWKHRCQSIFVNKVAGLKPCNFIKIETMAQMFPCKFCESFKNNFSYRTPPLAASRTFLKQRYIWDSVNHLCWNVYCFHKKGPL